VKILQGDLQCEVMGATGNLEQLRIRIQDASSAETCAALMGAIGLGSKPNYPWDQYPSRARTNILQILLTLSGYLADPTVHEA
jgi:hypothetical protein